MGMLKDLATHLQTKGVGTIGVDIFWGEEPEDQPGDTPTDNTLILYQYDPGIDPLQASSPNPGSALAVYDGLQVVARNYNSDTATAKLGAVLGQLQHFSGTPGSIEFQYIRADGGISTPKRPTKGLNDQIRHYRAQNYIVMRAP